MEISLLHDSRSIKSSPKNGCDKSQEEHSTHSDPVANVSSFYQQKAIVTSPESENLLQYNFLLDTADSQCSAPAIVRVQDSCPSGSPEAQLTAPRTTDDEDKRQDSCPSGSPEAQLTAPRTTDDEDKRQDSCPSDSPEAQLTAPRTTDDEDKRQDFCPLGSPEAQLTAPRTTDDEDKRQDSCPLGSPEAQLTAPRRTDDEDKRQDFCPSGSPEAQLTAPRRTDDEDKRQDSCPSGSSEAQLTAPRTTDDEEKCQDSCPSNSIYSQLAASEYNEKRNVSCPLESTDFQLTARKHQQQIACSVLKTDKVMVPFPVSDQVRSSISSQSEAEQNHKNPFGILNEDTNIENNVNEYIEVIIRQESDQNLTEVKDKCQDFLDTPEHQFTAAKQKQQIAGCVLQPDDIIIPFPEFDQVRNTISSRPDTEGNLIKPLKIIDKDKSIDHNENEYIEIVIIQESDESFDNVSAIVHEGEKSPVNQTDEIIEENQLAAFSTPKKLTRKRMRRCVA
ncbi:hypothetical protein O0L34_g19466 [Tuta absoluta]|nr:hypothetical protein O0L34_g19466 [Tuta absoluta]